MGRVRPEPAKPMRPSYITAEGAQRLRAELDHLWRSERPEVTAAVSAAAALGDRSENAEYIYGKKRLREIDRRVRFLRRRLEVLTVVERVPDDRSRVFFGAWVRLEDDAGRRRRVRIVGPDETDHAPRYVSVNSPVARALLGRRIDDEVTVVTPRGKVRQLILDVSYARPGSEDE
jgi:transcription elongation factor GreB